MLDPARLLAHQHCHAEMPAAVEASIEDGYICFDLVSLNLARSQQDAAQLRFKGRNVGMACQITVPPLPSDDYLQVVFGPIRPSSYDVPTELTYGEDLLRTKRLQSAQEVDRSLRLSPGAHSLPSVGLSTMLAGIASQRA